MLIACSIPLLVWMLNFSPQQPKKIEEKPRYTPTGVWIVYAGETEPLDGRSFTYAPGAEPRWNVNAGESIHIVSGHCFR